MLFQMLGPQTLVSSISVARNMDLREKKEESAQAQEGLSESVEGSVELEMS